MIEKLSRLKGWQIIVLGVTALVVALVATTFVAHLCYASFPDYYGWVAVGHILVAGAVGWFLPKPFLDAYLLKKWVAEAEAYMDYMVQMMGVSEAVKEPEAERG